MAGSATDDTLLSLSSTRGQRRQRSVPDRGPEEASSRAAGRQGPTSRETAQPASDSVSVVALTPKSAAARDQPARHSLPPQPGGLRRPLQKGIRYLFDMCLEKITLPPYRFRELILPSHLSPL